MKVYNPPVKKIGQLYNQGMPIAEISKKIGYSITTTRRWLEMYGVKPERRGPNKTKEQNRTEAIKLSELKCPYCLGEMLIVTAEMVSGLEGTFKKQRKQGRVIYKTSDNIGVRFENWTESFQIKSLGREVRIERMN